MEHKTCSKCGHEQPIENFSEYVRADRGGRKYLYSWCKACKNSVHDPKAARWSVLRNRYRLSPKDWQALLDSQGGKCAVCGAYEPGGQGTWHVDHDHSCCPTPKGKYKTCGNCVRGLLCHLCNTALGCARDDIEVLHSMIMYLEGAKNV